MALHVEGTDPLARRLRVRAYVLGVVWVCFWALAVVVVPRAVADPPTSCPDLSAVTAYGGTDDAASELRALRLELNTACQLDQAAASQLHDDLVAVHEDLTTAPLAVDPGGRDVNVTNQPDLTALQTAAVNGADTTHSDLWAIFGMAVGFGVLVAFYRLLRGDS